MHNIIWILNRNCKKSIVWKQIWLIFVCLHLLSSYSKVKFVSLDWRGSCADVPQAGSHAGSFWTMASSLTMTVKTTLVKEARAPSRCLCATSKVRKCSETRRLDTWTDLKWPDDTHQHLFPSHYGASSPDRRDAAGADHPRRAALLRPSRQRSRETEVAGGFRVVQGWNPGRPQAQRYACSHAPVGTHTATHKDGRDFLAHWLKKKKLCSVSFQAQACLARVGKNWKIYRTTELCHLHLNCWQTDWT